MQNFTTQPLVAISRGPIGIAPGQVILKAAHYEELVSLKEAWAKIKQLDREAITRAAKAQEQAVAQGLEEGKSAAQKLALGQVAQMHDQVNEWVKNTDLQLIELVNRCVAQVVHKIDPELLVRDAVEKGLAELVDATQIIVRVHPQTADISQYIEELVKQYGITGHVRVVPDGSLTPGDVIAESAVGVVDLRLKNQLSLISTALKP